MDTVLAGALAHFAQLFGGSLGVAILALSFGVRVALLPLTLSLARRGLRRQAILRTLQPEIDALKKRLGKRPEQLFTELRELYRRHDCSPFDLPALLSSFAQWPVFGLLYGTIRSALKMPAAFLWIKNLAAPDLLLTLTVLLLTGLSAYLAPGLAEQARTMLIVVQVIITAIVLWKLAAGLGLYWAASTSVGLLQNLHLRRSAAHLARTA